MDGELLNLLKRSPIKYLKHQKPKTKTLKDLAGFVIVFSLKNLLNRVLRAGLNSIKTSAKSKNLEKCREKEIFFLIRPDSKFFKSDLIKMKVSELLSSFRAGYQENLKLFAFKTMKFQASGQKANKSIFTVLKSVLLSRARSYFSTMQEYSIQIYYLHKRLKIDAKAHKKRYKSGFTLLLNIYRTRSSKMLLKLFSFQKQLPKISSLSSLFTLSQLHSRLKLKSILNKLKQS
jgi:hypothetical protein